MRTVLFTSLLLFNISLIGGPTPTVPSTIEIAGVKLKLTNDAQREIQNDVNALRASDRYFKIKLDRVNLYFPIIERILKEEGVPEELKYLAVQESALISDAVSSADAVGYWQFKDFTAREVGLRVDSKIDERKNIVSATRGAAKYFKMNNFYFKNWIYSVSAYQAGRGGASKYVDKDNFGSDKLTITSKSHWYVLRFIAHVIAFQDEVGGSHSEGLKLGEYAKGEGKTIQQIADDFKIDGDLAKDYNKWIGNGRIPDDKIYTVILPTKGRIPKTSSPDKNSEERPLTRTIEPVEEKLIYPDDLGVAKEHKTVFIRVNGLSAVMAGSEDNVVKLALKSGISSSKLIKYNDLKPIQSIEAGKVYYTRSKRNRSPIRFHTARQGESLWDISQKYGVKLKKLAKKNRMEVTDAVKIGRVMWLGKKRPKDTPVEYRKSAGSPVRYQPEKKVEKQPIKEQPKAVEEKAVITQPKTQAPTNVPKIPEPNSNIRKSSTDDMSIHVVGAGESLWAVAKKYSMDVSTLKEMNKLTSESVLSIGQELKVAVTEKNESTIERQNTKETHEVQSGESLWAIAKKLDLTVDQLREWNDLNENAHINPGQILKLSDEKSSSAEIKFETHTVKAGDSLYKIAQEYKVSVDGIKQLNNLNTNNLSIGDVLKIRAKN